MARHIGLVFDAQARPETTGNYCATALAEIATVERLSPDALTHGECHKVDLYLYIDDSLDYLIETALRPNAYWAIDTHLNFERTLRRARHVDFVFAAQRDGALRLQAEGLPARWLPLACDPAVHRRIDVEPQYDIAFVGNVFPGAREDLLRLFQERFPRSFVGRAYFEEMSRTYSASRLAFNRSLRNDVNMRVFEALACGPLLLTNDLTENGLHELFRDGEHLIAYRDGAELLELIDYYLKNDAERERIAAAGRKEVLARHTYRHRMEHVLAVCLEGAPPAFPMAKTTTFADPTYFGYARPELVELVPTSARRILDVGCAAGALGSALKRRASCRVTGVEQNSGAAARARTRLDEVLEGDIDQVELNHPDGFFDAIVCGDVLEHLREPVNTLKRLRPYLSGDGCLVASIPNVRNRTVLGSLLTGDWTYQSAGLLDATHLRFFTRREIQKLFFRAGYKIVSMGVIHGPGPAFQTTTEPSEVRLGPLTLPGVPPEEASEFHAYQYLVVAKPLCLGPSMPPGSNSGPASVRRFGLTSIVIPTHNQWEYTRQCLASIAQFTDEPYEIVAVDNGSMDGTVELLRESPGVRLIENSVNRGFPAAVNQGIAASRGDQVLLLNNDTLATTGWLWRMLDVLYSDPQIGLVGPCSNSVSGPQQIPVPYTELEGLDGFAWEWGRQHHREIVDATRLVGFCLLVRRPLIDAIGVLDERFGVGTFEDDDYTRRCLSAGFRAVIARGAFVHHFGSVTFRASKHLDAVALLKENERRFHEKWESPADTPIKPSPAVALAVRPGDGPLLLEPAKIVVSLCMIGRDNEKTLPACLESAFPWFDEIVFVDTGSTDRTVEIARTYGARVFHFPWCDDFSAARNVSISHARGEWVFWLDTDDTIPPEQGRKVREIIARHVDQRILGYIFQVHCPGNDATDVIAVDHLKLFRNRPDLRFEGRIHEQILQPLRRAGGLPAWTDGYVVHSGSDRTPEGLRRKVERDLRILHKDLEERPDHPFVLFNLGMTYADIRDVDGASKYLERCIAISPGDESHVAKAHALLVSALSRAGRHEEAWKACQRGLQAFPDDRELLFHTGALHLHFGRLRQAEQAYMALLTTRIERRFSSVMQGLDGYRARHNLARVLEEMGRLSDAAVQWQTIVAETPSYRPAWRGLAENLMQRADDQGTRRLAEDLRGRTGLPWSPMEAVWIEAKLAQRRGDFKTAEAVLAAALEHGPPDADAATLWCEVVCQTADANTQFDKLFAASSKFPALPVLSYYLGVTSFRRKRFDEAERHLRAALELRADSAQTYLWLGHVLKETGRTAEADAAYAEAARLNGGR